MADIIEISKFLTRNNSLTLDSSKEQLVEYPDNHIEYFLHSLVNNKAIWDLVAFYSMNNKQHANAMQSFKNFVYDLQLANPYIKQ